MYYLILNMGIFQWNMLVFRGVYDLYNSPIAEGKFVSPKSDLDNCQIVSPLSPPVFVEGFLVVDPQTTTTPNIFNHKKTKKTP